MLKIQLLDGCGSDDYIWLFPGTKSDLLACWRKAKIPCLYFRPEAVKNFEGTLSECDFEADDYNAIIMHSEHDDNGDHIHILIVDGEEFRLHENEVYQIITKKRRWPMPQIKDCSIPQNDSSNLRRVEENENIRCDCAEPEWADEKIVDGEHFSVPPFCKRCGRTI